jgi:hypothetical protein
MRGSPSNGTGTETDDAPFTLEPEIEDHPDKSTVKVTNQLLNYPRVRPSFPTHPTEPAKLVLKAAMAAFRFAANVEPALNPSHPTQSRTVPRITCPTL